MATLEQKRKQEERDAENARKARNTTNQKDEVAPFSLTDAEIILNKAETEVRNLSNDVSTLDAKKDKMTGPALKSKCGELQGRAMEAATPLTLLFSDLDKRAKNQSSDSPQSNPVLTLRDKAQTILGDVKSLTNRLDSLRQQGPKPTEGKDEKKPKGPSPELG